MKHNSIALLRSSPPVRRIFAAISIALSLVFALAAFGDPLGTAFTYQGQIKQTGTAYNGTCNFQFTLWNALSGGGQFPTTVTQNGVNVANGLFTVTLDFSDVYFAGDARWMQTAVQCGGDSGFTTLSPRQSLTPAPYALSLRPGANIEGSVADVGGALYVNNSHTSGIGIQGIGGATGVIGSASAADGRGVYGSANGASAAGVFGINSSGPGVWGKSTGAGPAVYGESTSTGPAGKFLGKVSMTGSLTVDGSSPNAIYANATGANGVGVFGNNFDVSTGWGLYGVGFTGVYGGSSGATNSVGVRGDAFGTTSVGVYGTGAGTSSIGVLGTTFSSTAVYGQSTGTGTAIYGQALGTGLAGSFSGPVNVQGTLTKSAGSFRIDHPLDPANKFLSHSFVESPDMKNIYDGNVVTDANGSATVTLPDYFDALNRDYRYQLTVLGQPAQAFVSREIAGNSFEIQTDKPGVKVSWQVTGIRQDAYAKAHPIVVDEFEPAEDRGLYLYPAGFGAGEEKRIGHLQGPALAPSAQQTATAESNNQARK